MDQAIFENVQIILKFPVSGYAKRMAETGYDAPAPGEKIPRILRNSQNSGQLLIWYGQ
jgi:hypothetical protein